MESSADPQPRPVADTPGPVLKLSSPATREYWEVPVLYLDDHLVAVDKPAGLLTCPDRYDPQRPNLMRLLHEHIARSVPWAVEHRLSYVANAHRLDFETSGVLLLARSKPVLTALANQFGSELPSKTYHALVQGSPEEDEFQVEIKLAPHPRRPGVVIAHSKFGKRSLTGFRVLRRFVGYSWIECRPRTGRTHQIRVHLKVAGCPIVADATYGGVPLRLSELKRGYQHSRGRAERPLMDRVALHASTLALNHPVTGDAVHIESPFPKDLEVALKYLERYATPGFSVR